MSNENKKTEGRLFACRCGCTEFKRTTTDTRQGVYVIHLPDDEQDCVEDELVEDDDCFDAHYAYNCRKCGREYDDELNDKGFGPSDEERKAAYEEGEFERRVREIAKQEANNVMAVSVGVASVGVRAVVKGGGSA